MACPLCCDQEWSWSVLVGVGQNNPGSSVGTQQLSCQALTPAPFKSALPCFNRDANISAPCTLELVPREVSHISLSTMLASFLARVWRLRDAFIYLFLILCIPIALNIFSMILIFPPPSIYVIQIWTSLFFCYHSILLTSSPAQHSSSDHSIYLFFFPELSSPSNTGYFSPSCLSTFLSLSECSIIRPFPSASSLCAPTLLSVIFSSSPDPQISLTDSQLLPSLLWITFLCPLWPLFCSPFLQASCSQYGSWYDQSWCALNVWNLSSFCWSITAM